MAQTLDPDCSDAPESGDTPRLQVSVTPGARGNVHVLVCGEIDLHNAAGLRGALLVALTTYRGTVTVDLEAVTFCDCAGLNALLQARSDALNVRRQMWITAAGRQVGRLLRLTGTEALLCARPTPAGGAGDTDDRVLRPPAPLTA
ncbi:STAS domain-containing protein [Streptomyces sp. NPDC058646]|uniref:STAS domain-containing protein n=1 Tax=Streptomyces sp. NPDC058646 TaxID=3346574 RepID=UPI0036585291